jgi:tetratricopeptide (TPR) repeat protein
MSQKQGQYAQCAKDYMLVIKLRPMSDYYFKAAACQRLAGALDLAEDLINEGHIKESGNYNYFREMGYLYELKGEKAQARKYFQDYLVLTAHNSVDAKEIESKLLSLGN